MLVLVDWLVVDIEVLVLVEILVLADVLLVEVDWEVEVL